MPSNTVQYLGVYYKNTVSFFVGVTDANGNKISGVQIHATEDFKIFKIERVFGFGIANVKGYLHKQYRWKLPIHPKGERPNFYAI